MASPHSSTEPQAHEGLVDQNEVVEVANRQQRQRQQRDANGPVEPEQPALHGYQRKKLRTSESSQLSVKASETS